MLEIAKMMSIPDRPVEKNEKLSGCLLNSMQDWPAQQAAKDERISQFG